MFAPDGREALPLDLGRPRSVLLSAASSSSSVSPSAVARCRSFSIAANALDSRSAFWEQLREVFQIEPRSELSSKETPLH